MPEKINIEAIALYVRVGGKTFLAPIAPETSAMFLGLVSAFQPGRPEMPRLIAMPESVSDLVDAAGVALGEHIDAIKAQKAEPS